ncbi:MAG: homoserine dehydrogenase [Spirochaetia bacterium]|nr:homoserine dehydrogenase [Spirochaetia bacterium]
MIRVGILGAGTVGSGLIQIIKENNSRIEIAGVVDKRVKELSGLLGDISTSENAETLLNDDSIDVIVELIGGVSHSYEFVKKALEKGKSVVTANKHLLAKHGLELFKLAKEKGAHIGYEAAVAGAIPVIRNLNSFFNKDKISFLEGILNGTSNYLLTKIRREEIPYETALTQAQEMGLAEADPALDVNGGDACHKLALLFYVITGDWVDYEKIYTIGIQDIKLTDILWAKSKNYKIKLIATFLEEDGKYYLSVEPTLINSKHHLFDIEMENNAILFHGKYSDTHMFMGKGAGSLPTAHSVYADILHFGKKHKDKAKPCQCEIRPVEAANLEERRSEFYIRLLLLDKPGVLSKISSVIGGNNISIASVQQNMKDDVEKNGDVEVMLITHDCLRGDLNKTIAELEKMTDLVKEKPVIMPLGI